MSFDNVMDSFWNSRWGIEPVQTDPCPTCARLHTLVCPEEAREARARLRVKRTHARLVAQAKDAARRGMYHEAGRLLAQSLTWEA